MLERASLCLDTGARLSLRCARRASRSNRQLHQTFWTHGAGDIELPPSLLDPYAHWREHAHQHDDRSHASTVAGAPTASQVATSATETPFLDFLYPPQALALLHRPSDSRWEKWEKRNAQRLPRGFVQATRGYASDSAKRRSDASNSNPKAEADPAELVPPEFMPIVKEKNDGSAMDLNENAQSTDETDATGVSDVELPEGAEGELWASRHPDVFARSDHPTAAQLRNLMVTSRRNIALEDKSKSLDHTSKAWAIYERLDIAERENLKLKTELLQFLATHHNDVAETHCLEIYSSIPVDERTMDIYKAALSVFLRSNLCGFAEQGHAEALDRLPNAHELSGWLCGFAIEREMWDMAFRVKQQLDARHEGMLQAVSAAVFWRQIAEVPDLLSRAISLSKHHRMLARAWTGAQTGKFNEFCRVIFKEGIIQEFVSKDGKGEPSDARKTYAQKKIRYLLGRVVLRNPEAATFYRDTIEALVHPESRVWYPSVHRVVSYMYNQYKTMTGVKVTQEMLHRLLDKVTRYYNRLSRADAGTAISINPTTLHKDWTKLYEKTPPDVLKRIMTFYALQGNVHKVSTFETYLCSQYPKYNDQQEALWASIYVHARRADVPSAKTAFDKVKGIAAASGNVPDLRCWNLLLHAHSRAGDLEGALETLQSLMRTSHRPDQYSFHPILEIYAAKGDAESVNDLLSQYDEICGKKRHTSLYGSLMLAYVNNNEIIKAQLLLEDIVKQRSEGAIRGSLTGCFNILLTTYAMRREVDAAMRVYRWMKSEQIIMDGDTYAALIQALVGYRQIHAARKILVNVMPERGIAATAFHYSLVMNGYVHQRMYPEAASLGQKMINRNIKRSVSFNVAYLKAKTMLENKQNPRTPELPALKLENALQDLDDMLKLDVYTGVANKERQNNNLVSPEKAEATTFQHLIYIHGRRGCLDAANELIERWKARVKAREDSDHSSPFTYRLLAAIMVTSIGAEDWKQVDECWRLAKAQADADLQVPEVPPIKAMLGTNPAPEMLEMPLLYPPEQQDPTALPEGDAQVTAKEETSDAPTELVRKPHFGHILRRVLPPTLTQLITALALQSRFMDMISTVASILSEGYVLDNRTWNHFIESLLDARPPLALLAFRLTERYLINNFPGWRHDPKYLPNTSHRAQGLQHIKAAYLRPGQLMPQYRTLVKLASAMLQLSQMEALGRVRERDPGLRKFVGSTSLIKRLAPRTLHVVQIMPAVSDKLQRTLLPKHR